MLACSCIFGSICCTSVSDTVLSRVVIIYAESNVNSYVLGTFLTKTKHTVILDHAVKPEIHVSTTLNARLA